jgi:hypothetical protein
MISRFVIPAVIVSVLAMGTVGIEAQTSDRPLELRLDVAQLSIDPVGISAFFPGSGAIAVYLSEKLAVEGRASFGYSDSFWSLGAGASVPFYLAADGGRSGFFVAPALDLGKAKESDLLLDYGVDAGIKIPFGDRTSWRVAATVRDGDSFGDITFGAQVGMSLFFR